MKKTTATTIHEEVFSNNIHEILPTNYISQMPLNHTQLSLHSFPSFRDKIYSVQNCTDYKNSKNGYNEFPSTAKIPCKVNSSTRMSANGLQSLRVCSICGLNTLELLLFNLNLHNNLIKSKTKLT